MRVLLMVLVLVVPSSVLAADCGGVAPPCGTGVVRDCQCGDTVRWSYILSNSLSCTGSLGLAVAAGQTLSVGNNVTISGNGTAESVGILFAEDGATAVGQTNLSSAVTGWHYGVRFTGSSNIAKYLHVHANNKYGIDLRNSTGGTAASNTIDTCLVESNSDEGVHFGGGSSSNTLRASTMQSNTNQQVYFANSDSNTLDGNTLTGTTGALLRISNSNSNVIKGNQFNGRRVIVTAGSAFNNFTTPANVFTNSTILFEPGQFNVATADCNNPAPFLPPHDNTVEGIQSSGTNDSCVQFSGFNCPSPPQYPYSNSVKSATMACTGNPSGYQVRSLDSGVDAQPDNVVCASTCGSPGHACANGPPDVADPKDIITLSSSCS